jgi:predicted nuclease of predicted toxin-antitoxin system
MKLLLDENLSVHHAQRLREAKWDAIGVVETGLGGADDHTVRHYAVEHDRVLVTLDADFGNLLRFSPAGTPGVIWLRPAIPSETAIAALLQRALYHLAAQSLRHHLVVVDETTIRMRSSLS